MSTRLYITGSLDTKPHARLADRACAALDQQMRREELNGSDVFNRAIHHLWLISNQPRLFLGTRASWFVPRRYHLPIITESELGGADGGISLTLTPKARRVALRLITEGFTNREAIYNCALISYADFRGSLHCEFSVSPLFTFMWAW